MDFPSFVIAKLKDQDILSFADFMQTVLYAPEGGYYMLGMGQFGKDFTTAPQISPLFAHTLAIQCRDILGGLTQPILFEFGAGSGQLCVDLLSKLEELDCLPHAYHILELSGTLRAQQEEKLQQALPHLAAKVQWLDSWPLHPFEGCILANEVLDAMPVHRFLQSQETLYEVCIGLTPEGGLQEVLQVCSNRHLAQQVSLCIPRSLYPYQSEVNLTINDWLKNCSTMLRRGVMLVIDYGFPRREYYHPDRNQGTLMCHYQHHSHTNPLAHLGQQDITAHVDFTHVAEAAFASGFKVAGFTTQASFLLANDLLSLLGEATGDAWVQQQKAVKTLLQPNEMGELFKVMALTKDWITPLRGFQLQDKRGCL